MPIKQTMSSPAIDPPRVSQRRPGEQPDHWERDRVARSQVGELLENLPAGFVIFRDLELPKPSRSSVHHLVVGPRTVWAVTTHVLADAVTFGTGRNADTLWSGRTPLRTMLEAADWEATTIARLLGVEVEPVVCVIAPGVPDPTFDFHGIRITTPNSLVEHVATSTSGFVDVAKVVSVVERVFDARPVAGTAAPTLAVPVVPGVHRQGYAPRPRRSVGARVHALNKHRIVRVGGALALLAVVLVFLPAIRGLWNSVATEGAERLTDVIDEVGDTGSSDDAGADQVPADDAVRAPMTVGHQLTCATPGAGWDAAWEWPGPLPDGVAGYSIRIQIGNAPPVVHSLLPWSEPTSPPPPARISQSGPTTVFTDHRAPNGEVVATTSDVIEAPSDPC